MSLHAKMEEAVGAKYLKLLKGAMDQVTDEQLTYYVRHAFLTQEQADAVRKFKEESNGRD